MALMSKEDRCRGHCCEQLILSYSPEEIWDSYSRWRTKGDTASIAMHGSKPAYLIFSDVWLVAPMLIYLGFKKDPNKKVRRDVGLIAQHVYTCKHFNKKSRDCEIYEYRPQMCRDYPYGSKCNLRDCTWESCKEKPETAKERKDRLRVLNDQGDKPTDWAKARGK